MASAVKLGSTSITNAKLGSTQVSKIYQGSNLIWENAAGGLVSGYKVYFDFGNSASYPGTGTSVTNLGSGGSSYNASLVNSPSWSSSNGGVLTLSKASSQYISFNTDLTAQFTTFAIIKHDGSGTEWGTSGGDYSGWPNIRGNNGFILTNDINAGTLVLPIIWGGSSATVLSGNFIYPTDISVFHSYSYTSNGSNDHNMYLDNDAAANSTTTVSRSNSSTIASYIGYDQPNNGYLNGKVMAYLQYDRVLSSAEIAQNYSFFSSRF